LRIDAAKSIPYFFAQLVNNATDSYSIGEVFDGDAGYACDYQTGGLDAFLNFPIYYQVLYLLFA
jgi:alpha-amylase